MRRKSLPDPCGDSKHCSVNKSPKILISGERNSKHLISIRLLFICDEDEKIISLTGIVVCDIFFVFQQIFFEIILKTAMNSKLEFNSCLRENNAVTINCCCSNKLLLLESFQGENTLKCKFYIFLLHLYS